MSDYFNTVPDDVVIHAFGKYLSPWTIIRIVGNVNKRFYKMTVVIRNLLRWSIEIWQDSYYVTVATKTGSKDNLGICIDSGVLFSEKLNYLWRNQITLKMISWNTIELLKKYKYFGSIKHMSLEFHQWEYMYQLFAVYEKQSELMNYQNAPKLRFITAAHVRISFCDL